MSWLLRDGEVLATVQARCKGWRAFVDGAVIIPRPGLVGTFGRSTSVGLDVARCSAVELDPGRPGLQVRRIWCLPPHRVAPPVFGPGVLVVARPGSFERWQLHVGDRLEVRGG